MLVKDEMPRSMKHVTWDSSNLFWWKVEIVPKDGPKTVDIRVLHGLGFSGKRSQIDEKKKYQLPIPNGMCIPSILSIQYVLAYASRKFNKCF